MAAVTPRNTIQRAIQQQDPTRYRTRTVEPEKGKGRKSRPRQKGPSDEDVESGSQKEPFWHSSSSQVAAAAYRRNERQAGGGARAVAAEPKANTLGRCPVCHAPDAGTDHPKTWKNHRPGCEAVAAYRADFGPGADGEM